MSGYVALLVAVLAWGAFSFGGIYPWGYWPLLGGCTAAGVWGWVSSRQSRKEVARAPVTLGLAVVCLAIVVQLIPLPSAFVERLSPSRETVVRLSEAAETVSLPSTEDRFREPRAGGNVGSRPLSIAPRSTATALAFASALGIFFVGASQKFSSRDVQSIARGITVLGVLLAVLGLFWRPMVPKAVEQMSDGADIIVQSIDPQYADGPGGDDTFGPFGNRNHFAGWMLMTIPVAIGDLLARFHREQRKSRDARRRGRRSKLRRDLKWVLGSAGIIVMGVAVFVTQSRSGIGGVVLGLGAMGFLLTRGPKSKARRSLLAGFAVGVILLVLIIVGAGEVGATLSRYAEVNSADMGGRVPIWRDALRIAHDFPIAGTGLNTYERAAAVYRTTSYRHQAAHNDYLEIASDGGLLLVVPALVLAVLFIREVRKRFREDAGNSAAFWQRSGAVVGLCAIACQELFEFSLQIPGVTALFVVLCAMAVHRVARETAKPQLGSSVTPSSC